MDGINNDENWLPSSFLQNNRNLLGGLKFNVEGLVPELQRDFIQIFKDLGATFCKDAKYIFTEYNYFEQSSNKIRTDLYSLAFILHAVENAEIPKIDLYRFYDSTNEKEKNNKENYISNGEKKENKFDGIIEVCSSSSSDDCNSDNTRLVKSNSNVENLKLLKTDKRKNLKDSDSSSKSDWICTKRVKIKDNKNNAAGEVEENNVNIKIEHINEESSILASDNFLRYKRLNIETSLPLEKIKNVNNQINIDRRKIKVEDDIIIEEKIDEINWWEDYQVPKADVCKIPDCSFEPVPHKKHQLVITNLSMDEKKILLKYLITRNKIYHAKSLTIYDQMRRDGFLTHRSSETLRNCFRRSILKNLNSFVLPDNIMTELEEMNRPLPKGKGRYTNM